MPIRPFQLLIKPVSADCNLRCAYCFYLRTAALYPQDPRHCMSDAVLETMIKGLLAYRFPETVFAWQGGEPTLAGIEFYRKAVALEQQHGADGQIVGNAFQTNGILIDDDWCDLFREYRFLVGLSLDGPKEVHDRYRTTGNGTGTWEKVMAAADLMLRHGVEFNILCLVNRDNVKMGVDLLRWYEQQGFRHVQFIPCVEPGQPLNVPAAEYGKFLVDTFTYWSREGFRRIAVREFDALLSSALGQPGGLCTYGARCDAYIVIEHNGDVYPCDFFVKEEWRLGNIMDAPLHTFRETERYRQFAYQKDKVPACAGCTWRAMCHGGCQKDRLVGGTLSSPSALCDAYKMFFSKTHSRIKSLARYVERQQKKQAVPGAAPGNYR